MQLYGMGLRARVEAAAFICSSLMGRASGTALDGVLVGTGSFFAFLELLCQAVSPSGAETPAMPARPTAANDSHPDRRDRRGLASIRATTAPPGTRRRPWRHPS